MTAARANGTTDAMLRRFIHTKYQTYEIPLDAVGVPIQQYFKGVKLETLPRGFAEAKVYQTPDGPVVVVPEPTTPPAHDARQPTGKAEP